MQLRTRMKPNSFDDIKRFTRDCLAKREASNLPSHFRPSNYWKYFVRNFAYVFDLPDQELKRIRYHTYHLTGDTYFFYEIRSSDYIKMLQGEYLALVNELGGFAPGERETDFGYEINRQLVTVDLIRYMQVLSDLHRAEILNRNDSPRILEIGGGYGGLASTCMNYNPKTIYIISDLEETMFFQAIYLSNRFDFDSVELCPDGISPGHVFVPGRFYLLPQSYSDTLPSACVDIVINQQSLQEMAPEQIRHYFEVVRKVSRYFYSCNMDQHDQAVVKKLGIVSDLQTMLDHEFRSVKWQSRSGTINKLRRRVKLLKDVIWSKFLGRPLRVLGDHYLRRVIYDVVNK